MSKHYFGILCCLGLFLSQWAQAHEIPKYKNAQLSIETRTQDLLGRMTLEEKVGQLLCPLGWEMYDKNDLHITSSKKFEDLENRVPVGMLWATFRADPWTQKTLATGVNPEQAAEAANALQRYVMEHTRLGIPLFFAEEAAHGHMAIGATVFPTGLGQASTWDPKLIEQMAAQISKELRLTGAHIAYGPILDLARDPRWSRVEETYGEDPTLITQMGVAFVQGLGSGRLDSAYSTIATLKHFIAYGMPDGGHNGNGNSVGMRDLEENYLPPFHAAIDQGALSVMSAYNSVDGIPCTGNKYLLQDVLRKEWKYTGFVVSDLGAIEGLSSNHYVVKDNAEAANLALSSGVDCDLGGNAYTHLIESVKSHQVSESLLDRAVSRILGLKFAMGLFEHPYVDPKAALKNNPNSTRKLLAQKVAEESIVLLKNDQHLLPLSTDLQRVAVIGPNADNVYNQLGDYTAPQSQIATVLDGIKKQLKPSQISYVKGCSIRDTTHTEIAEAVTAAKQSNVAIVVLGGSSARDFKTTYQSTGAAVVPATGISDMECGEGYDRESLDLLGKQLDLLKAVVATGTPTVVIYIQGRPLNMNWASEHAAALLTAWYPGEAGGDALANVLFGMVNPAGRLPISIPRSVGQLPVYYNQRNPSRQNYVEMSSQPLYPFGYGLSYTTFAYSNLQLVQKGAQSFEAQCTVQNTGDRDGDEVVQLYLRDQIASTSQPLKQLKGFQRVHIEKGSSKEIHFLLNAHDFSMINAAMKRVVEPGTFEVMIGGSSDQIQLKGIIEIKNKPQKNKI